MDIPRPILLLILLFSLSCSVQAAILNITVIDDADDTPLRDVVLSVNGDYAGKTGNDGTYRYSHVLNDSFYLKASKFGYDDRVTMVSPTETSLTIQLTRKSEMITIIVYDRETLKPLLNAFVKVSGETISDTGQTDSSGKVQFSLKSGGIYTVEITSAHYEPVLKTVDLRSGERILQYWLYRNDLFIISVLDASTQQRLENATITINTKVAGSTGADGRLLLNLERELKYQIAVELPDYQPAVVEKYLTHEDLLIEFPLIKSIYPVSIAVFDEQRRPVEGAILVIDGQQKGKTDKYGRLGIATLAAGSYLLEIRAEGYEPWREMKNISGHSEELVVELALLSVNVTIRVQDPEGRAVEGAMVVIDGARLNTTNLGGEVVAPLKTGMVYNLSATREGYRSSTLTRELPLGSPPITITITLERELDTGLILTTLVGIVVIIGVLLAVRTFWLERRTRRPRRH